MTPPQTPAPDLARRPARRRWVAARYDGAHASLVRVVHPLCFSAFAITALVLAAAVLYLVLDWGSGGEEILGVLIGVLCVLGMMVVAAFAFVITPARAVFGLVLLGGWATAFTMRDTVPWWLLWSLWVIAAISVLLQVVLLARAVPDRWRNGLMHLMWPATLGTAVGAAPVVLGLNLLAQRNYSRTQDLTVAAFLAGCGVLVALLVLHVYGNRGDGKVLADFARRHGLTTGWVPTVAAGTDVDALATIDTSDIEVPRMIQRLVPKFANYAGPWRGTAMGREVSVVTGYSSTAAPDLPSVHLTVLAIQLAGTGRDVWVRRNSWTHDNVLASLGRSEVVEFESITLSEEYSVRFPAGTDRLDAFTTFGPQVVDLLATSLDDAQVCRIGDGLLVFLVGGVLSATELDRMLETGCAFASLLERADASMTRPATR